MPRGVRIKGQARKKEPPASRGGRGLLGEDPGDDRLSRQRHYHGPGGLNGRVRNGNGCGPASMVAGNSTGRPSGRCGRSQTSSPVTRTNPPTSGRGVGTFHRIPRVGPSRSKGTATALGYGKR